MSRRYKTQREMYVGITRPPSVPESLLVNRKKMARVAVLFAVLVTLAVVSGGLIPDSIPGTGDLPGASGLPKTDGLPKLDGLPGKDALPTDKIPGLSG